MSRRKAAMPSDRPTDKVTLATIADATNVSQATVSLVLRGKPGVGSETRQRVIEAAQALGYSFKTPASTSGALPKTDVRNLGVVLTAPLEDLLADNQFYTPVLAGIESVCRRYDINLLYANMPVDERNNALEVPRLLMEGNVDGVLMVGECLDQRTLATLRQRKLPTVLVDAYAPGNPFDVVVTDNEQGAYEAVRHLISLGHQHIALIGSNPASFPSINERREGYLRALAEQSLEPIIIESELDRAQVVQPVTELLSSRAPVSALFGCNDLVAWAASHTAQRLGRRVPEDLSVAGFDNILQAREAFPPLTTMRVDKIGMGRIAAQLIVNRIENPESAIVRAVIRPQLILRESTCPPPAAPA